MTDLSKTIAPKSDQLNADDLISGSIDVVIRDVTGNQGGDQPVNVFYEGDNGKPYRPCKSMRRVMVHVWGADGKGYIGKAMRLYCDPKVKFGNIEVGGIRISHMSGIDGRRQFALTTTRSQRKPYIVEPMPAPRRDADQDAGPSEAEILEAAKKEARKGREPFIEWYNSPAGKEVRDVIKPHMSTLQTICDNPGIEGEDPEGEDPFGGAMNGEGSTDEERAEADRVMNELEDEQRRNMDEGAES